LYTVAPVILAECAVRTRTRGASLCVHAAETRAEEEYARGRLGPIQDFLRDLQLDDDSAHAFGMTPIEHLAQLEVLGPGTLLAHGNYLSPSDIQCLSRAGTSVAYCPRTHHAFGHDRHPVRELIEAGVNVCLGTDSLASNPTLSVLEEMRFIHQHRPEVGAGQVFKMATGNGAAALGWLDETGTIEAGKRADFVVLPVELDGPDDPLINVLGGQAGPSCVVLAGEMVST
jgi:cytosine/adenosine deaminase-related metal-dependent hydrolase